MNAFDIISLLIALGASGAAAYNHVMFKREIKQAADSAERKRQEAHDQMHRSVVTTATKDLETAFHNVLSRTIIVTRPATAIEQKHGR